MHALNISCCCMSCMLCLCCADGAELKQKRENQKRQSSSEPPSSVGTLGESQLTAIMADARIGTMILLVAGISYVYYTLWIVITVRTFSTIAWPDTLPPQTHVDLTLRRLTRGCLSLAAAAGRGISILRPVPAAGVWHYGHHRRDDPGARSRYASRPCVTRVCNPLPAPPPAAA